MAGMCVSRCRHADSERHQQSSNKQKYYRRTHKSIVAHAQTQCVAITLTMVYVESLETKLESILLSCINNNRK